MKILDLFSGVGGLAIAVERLIGTSTSMFCERDPYAQRVLRRHLRSADCWMGCESDYPRADRSAVTIAM